MTTHLSDESKLQRHIEGNLGVIGCQFLGSAGERSQESVTVS